MGRLTAAMLHIKSGESFEKHMENAKKCISAIVLVLKS